MLYLFPLISAMIYPFGSLWTKQGQALGMGPWRIALIGNLIIAGCFMTLILLRPPIPDWSQIGWPILAGVCFFGGQFFTVLALRFGDVSLIAPIMGCKILFVALYSSLLGVEQLGPLIWFAAALAAAAIFVMSWNPRRSRPKTKQPSVFLTVGLALLSCGFFGGVDTVFSLAGQRFGKIPALLVGMFCFAVISLAIIPLARREPLPTAMGRKVIIRANLAYGVQAVILNLANVWLAKPTVINIIYSSRGLFGITHTWFIGHWFENRERQDVGAGMMVRRCVGAIMLMGSIMLVVFSKSN